MSSNFSVDAISGHKKGIEDVGAGCGYVAFNPQDDANKPLDFSAIGNGDPLGYKQASIWT